MKNKGNELIVIFVLVAIAVAAVTAAYYYGGNKIAALVTILTTLTIVTTGLHMVWRIHREERSMMLRSNMPSEKTNYAPVGRLSQFP